MDISVLFKFPVWFILFCAILLLASTIGCSSASERSTVETVDHVDLARYAGKWYEIARLPARFQEGCENSSADYSLEGGGVRVVNRCFRAGVESVAEGNAKVVDAATNSKLKVSFFWPFYGDYWIVELGQDYEYSVVSDPERKYLWILSRTPAMDSHKLAAIVARLKKAEFDTDRLIYNSKS